MPKPHRLEYASDRPETPQAMGTGYRVVAGLNTFSLVCSGLFLLLMSMVANDRMGALLGMYLAFPAVGVHCAIAGLPAWVYLAGAERTPANRQALSRLLIRSLLPLAVIGLAVLVTAIFPKTK